MFTTITTTITTAAVFYIFFCRPIVKLFELAFDTTIVGYSMHSGILYACKTRFY